MIGFEEVLECKDVKLVVFNFYVDLVGLDYNPAETPSLSNSYRLILSSNVFYVHCLFLYRPVVLDLEYYYLLRLPVRSFYS